MSLKGISANILKKLYGITGDSYVTGTAYTAGSYVIYDGDFYKALVDTSTTWVATEWSKVNVASQLGGGISDWSCIAPEYSETTQYYPNDIIIHEGKTYYCKGKSLPGPWNPDEWIECPLSKLIIYDAIADIWSTETAYGAGKWVTYRGHLYICGVEQATIGVFKDDEWIKMSIDETLRYMVMTMMGWIAPYFEEREYEKHSTVLHEDIPGDMTSIHFYRAKTNLVAGPWNPDDWEQTNLSETRKDLAFQKSITDEWKYDKTYVKGDCVMMNGKLCKAVVDNPTVGEFKNDEWDLTNTFTELAGGGEKGIAPAYSDTKDYEKGDVFVKKVGSDTTFNFTEVGGVAPTSHNSTMSEYFRAFTKAFEEAYNTPLVWGWDATNSVPTCAIATPFNSSFYGAIYQTYMNMGAEKVDNESNTEYISVYEAHYHDSVIYGTVFYVPAGKQLAISNAKPSDYYNDILAFKRADNITPGKDYVYNPGFRPTRHGDTVFYGENLVETMNTHTISQTGYKNYYIANEDSWVMVALYFNVAPSTDDPTYKKKILDAFTFTVEDGYTNNLLAAGLEVVNTSSTYQITHTNKRAIMNDIYQFGSECIVGELIVRNTSPAGANRLQIRISQGPFDTEFDKTENGITKWYISPWLKKNDYVLSTAAARPVVIQDWTDEDEVTILPVGGSGWPYYVEVRKDDVTVVGYEDYQYITVTAQPHEMDNYYTHGYIGGMSETNATTTVYFNESSALIPAISYCPTLKQFNSNDGIFKITNSDPTNYKVRIALIKTNSIGSNWKEYKKDGVTIGYNVDVSPASAEAVAYSSQITGDIAFYNFDTSNMTSGTGYYYGVEISRIDGTKVPNPRFLDNIVKVEVVPYLSCSVRDSNKYFSDRNNKTASLKDNMLIKLNDLPTGNELLIHDKGTSATIGALYATVISIPTDATLTNDVIRTSSGNIIFKEQVAPSSINIQYLTTDQSTEIWTSKIVGRGTDASFTSAEIIPGRDNYLVVSTYGLSSLERFLGYNYLQRNIEVKYEAPIADHLDNAAIYTTYDPEIEETTVIITKDDETVISNDAFMKELNTSGADIRFKYTGTSTDISIKIIMTSTGCVTTQSDLIIDRNGLKFKSGTQEIIDGGTAISAFTTVDYYEGIINSANPNYEVNFLGEYDWYVITTFTNRSSTSYTYDELKAMLSIEVVTPNEVNGYITTNGTESELYYRPYGSDQGFVPNNPFFKKYTENKVITANVTSLFDSNVSNGFYMTVIHDAELDSSYFIDNGNNTYTMYKVPTSEEQVGTVSCENDVHMLDNDERTFQFEINAGDMMCIEYNNVNSDPEIIDQIKDMYEWTETTPVYPEKVHQNIVDTYGDLYTENHVEDKKYITDNTSFIKYYDTAKTITAYRKETPIYDPSKTSEMAIVVIEDGSSADFNKEVLAKQSSGDYILKSDFEEDKWLATCTFTRYSVNYPYTESNPCVINVSADSYVIITYSNYYGDDAQFDTIKNMYVISES